MASAEFRFYAELNNFLAPACRQRFCSRALSRDASVKHMIEALGVPHTEVDLILVNGEAVDFSYRLANGDRVSVYPCFRNVDIAPLAKLRDIDPGPPRFIADAHLGQLAKSLRMLGFDVLYRNDYGDLEVAAIASGENRIVLTRDRDLLIRKDIVRGAYVHAIDGDEQVMEIVRRFRLADSARALTRCLNCNGMLRTVEKSAVADRVPKHSRHFYQHFYECDACAQVYWEGSHAARMRERVARMLNGAFPGYVSG